MSAVPGTIVNSANKFMVVSYHWHEGLPPQWPSNWLSTCLQPYLWQTILSWEQLPSSPEVQEWGPALQNLTVRLCYETPDAVVVHLYTPSLEAFLQMLPLGRAVSFWRYMDVVLATQPTTYRRLSYVSRCVMWVAAEERAQ